MFVAVVVSRLVQNLSPLRPRPLHSGDPAYVAPLGMMAEMPEHWSSFPSDHAALSFALSTALWHFSRQLGALAYAWSLLIVCLPRIYAGYHYASDVLGGAIIGTVVVLCLPLFLPTKAAAGRASNVAARYPGLFNAGFFILMFFFATMFDDIRQAANGLFK
jgi:undecaprenyl-diphosphatase